MKVPEANLPLGWDRVSGLLAWWGMPGTIDAGETNHADRTQALVGELNKLVQEASSQQMQTLSEANEQFTQALREFLSARQPSDLMAAQARLVTGFMESAAAQAGAWATLTQELHSCCSAMVQAAGTDAVGRSVPLEPPSDAARPTARGRGRSAVQD